MMENEKLRVNTAAEHSINYCPATEHFSVDAPDDR